MTKAQKQLEDVTADDYRRRIIAKCEELGVMAKGKVSKKPQPNVSWLARESGLNKDWIDAFLKGKHSNPTLGFIEDLFVALHNIEISLNTRS